MIDFRTGVPYTFLVKNAGTRPLCFYIAPPVNATGSLGASQTKALLTILQSHLPVGDVVTAAFTFPDSAAGTDLEFSCLLTRENGDNMRLAITVTK